MSVLFIFMAWGLIAHRPLHWPLQPHALRDSVTWSYGFFAIAVSITLDRRPIPGFVAGFPPFVVPFVVWVPIGTVIWVAVGGRIPSAPGSDVPIVDFKAGDAGVFLAAIAAFVLTGLWNSGRVAFGSPHRRFVWVGWLVGFVFRRGDQRGWHGRGEMAAFLGPDHPPFRSVVTAGDTGTVLLRVPGWLTRRSTSA